MSAPSITTMTTNPASNGTNTVTAGQTLTVLVTFSANVTLGTLTANLPSIALVNNSGTNGTGSTDIGYAVYSGGSGSPTLTFTYVVNGPTSLSNIDAALNVSSGLTTATLTSGTSGAILMSNNTLRNGISAAIITYQNTTAQASLGGTLACYAEGTRIATPNGYVPVETLQIGSMVRTADGNDRPVKWLGEVYYDGGVLRKNAHFRPVVFQAGALGDGLPIRDLRVSSQHGMLLDGVIVPAAALINGVSIRRDDRQEHLTYYHIELDNHDLVLAEGAASETFIDAQSRDAFDNVNEFYALYGEAVTVSPAVARVEEGYMLEAIRRRLGAIAGIENGKAQPGRLHHNIERLVAGTIEGWVYDTDHPEAAVEIEAVVDGEVVGQAIANRYRADLEYAGLAGGRCGFTMTMPASVISLDDVTFRRACDGALLETFSSAAA